MFYVLKPKLTSWKNSDVQAVIQTPMHWEMAGKWCFSQSKYLQPWAENIPDFTFEVKSKAPHLDNYWTGTELDLYSVRLVALLKEAKITFEAFDATVVDRKTKQMLSLEYKVFRPLEMYPAIDTQRSHIRENGYRNLKISEDFVLSKRLLFRDSELQELILIHEDLKKILEQEEITGCNIIPVEEHGI